MTSYQVFAEIRNESTLAAAIKLCRGTYQEDILTGREAISGSTLKGNARNYSDRYKASSTSILSRCQAAGLAVREEIQKYGKRVVIVG